MVILFINYLTRRVHGDRVTDFFLNFVKLKFPYVVKKWQIHTTHYSEILEKTVLILWRIFADFHIPCVWWVLQGLMWPSGYRRCIFSGDISGSDLAVGFFFFFFKISSFMFSSIFCSPLLVSVFLILLIISVKFKYSINRKLYFISCFIQ